MLFEKDARQDGREGGEGGGGGLMSTAFDWLRRSFVGSNNSIDTPKSSSRYLAFERTQESSSPLSLNGLEEEAKKANTLHRSGSIDSTGSGVSTSPSSAASLSSPSAQIVSGDNIVTPIQTEYPYQVEPTFRATYVVKRAHSAILGDQAAAARTRGFFGLNFFFTKPAASSPASPMMMMQQQHSWEIPSTAFNPVLTDIDRDGHSDR